MSLIGRRRCSAPPARTSVVAESSFEFAMRAARRVEGKYGVRLIRPEEIKCEIRWRRRPAPGQSSRSATCRRTADPVRGLRAGGSWSSCPTATTVPAARPYLEETCYYRIDQTDGFAIHRNYRLDNDGRTAAGAQRRVGAITQGYHPVAAARGATSISSTTWRASCWMRARPSAAGRLSLRGSRQIGGQPVNRLSPATTSGSLQRRTLSAGIIAPALHSLPGAKHAIGEIGVGRRCRFTGPERFI